MSNDLTPQAKAIIRRELVQDCANAFFAYLATHENAMVVLKHRDRMSLFGSFVNEIWAQWQEDLDREMREP